MAQNPSTPFLSLAGLAEAYANRSLQPSAVVAAHLETHQAP